MDTILGTILITIGVSIPAIGIGYFLWYMTRPKKKTWNAYVWKLTDGVLPSPLDKEGNKIRNYELSDLRFYGIDKLVKEEKEKGVTVYKLIKLNRTVTEPKGESELINKLNKSTGFVNVIYNEDSCNLVNAGYDKNTSNLIWNPLPYDRMTSLKNDIAVRRDRIAKKKDILQVIMPYVAIVVSLIAIIGMVYISVNGGIKIAEEQTTQTEMLIEAQKEMQEMNKQMLIDILGVERENLNINRNIYIPDNPKIE